MGIKRILKNFTMKEITDLMLDVETLGTHGKFVVLEIALVPFNIEGTNGNSLTPFNENINIEEQLNKGFDIDVDTMKWWLSSERIKTLGSNLSKPRNSIRAAITDLHAYIIKFENLKRVWATASLDYQAIDLLSAEANLPNPIPYQKRWCARTLREMYFLKSGVETYAKDNNHSAVDDCKNQIKYITEQFNELIH